MKQENIRRINTGKLSVDQQLHNFAVHELLPQIDIDPAAFWSGLAEIVETLTPENRLLLKRRDELQEQIDAWHAENPGPPNPADYKTFLKRIGYLVEPGPQFAIDTRNVDSEVSRVAGPQLVVPVNNARYALNAANARWGSLYDALYGTDVIDTEDGKEKTSTYNPKRGEAVISYSAAFLDQALPLKYGSHAEVAEYRLAGNNGLSIVLDGGRETALASPDGFVGYAVSRPQTRLLFRHNGLHLEIVIDPEHEVGKQARANVADVILESAVTTIQDCEDSVAAVDAEDKTQVYRNWFRLMQGTLETEVTKGGKSATRRLQHDRRFTGVNGSSVVLPGRSLMLVRNVGHLMQTDAIMDLSGNEVFEGILDAVFTVAGALNDVRGKNGLRNSRTGSIYIVKPKMHGPDEVAFTNRLMEMVENLFDLPTYTVKIGVMDEERRTTVNLAECIRAVRHRLVFINTGFLDRTGDEIHTSMRAGPALPKEQIKQAAWLQAYEDRNVDVGIACGLPGKAQIGKGMFPKTDEMREMVDTKQAHVEAGANCAWVPSPTAATLHAMHYHGIAVTERQRLLTDREMASLDAILTPPLGDPQSWSPEQVQKELDNNAQSILGYVVRWIDHGIGCSKVPDINGVNLMEDRATLRISSQHIANWLLHGVCSEEQVRTTLRRIAALVDAQNAGDPDYTPMSEDFDNSTAFMAASQLVLKGTGQPNGYTEPTLHAFRRWKKHQDMPA